MDDYSAAPVLLLILGGWLFVAAIPALIAGARGRGGFEWFFYGLLLFPIALLHAISLRPTRAILDSEAQSAGDKTCPQCAELVRRNARACRWCGADVADVDPGNPYAGRPSYHDPDAGRAASPAQRPKPLSFS